MKFSNLIKTLQQHRSFWVLYVLLFFMMVSGYYITDIFLKLGYMMDELERIFIREFPRWGKVLFALCVSLPQKLAFGLVPAFLAYGLNVFLSSTALGNKTKQTAKRIIRRLWGIPEGLTYERFLLRNILFTAVMMALFAGGYFLLPELLKHEEMRNAFQLLLGRIFVLIFVFHWMVIGILNYSRTFRFLKSFLLSGGNAYGLAVSRMILFSFLILLYINRMLESAFWTSMPDSARVPLPFTSWWSLHIPVNPELYQAICVMGIALCFMAILGLATRWVLWMNVFAGFYILGVPLLYGKLFHIHIWWWFPLLFALSRPSDVWSLDALIRRRKGKTVPYPVTAPVYGLPIKFMLLHFGIIYFFAGIIKLWESGFDWALSGSVINQMQVEWIQHYDKVPALRADKFPALVKAGSLLVILFELFFPFLILSGRLRTWAFIGGLVFHNLVAYFMYIGFEDLQFSYLVIVNWGFIIGWVHKQPFPKPENLSELMPPGWDYKKLLLGGGLLFSLNVLCGVFRIHSWPFSSYPTYSMLVKDSHTYVYFEVRDPSGTLVNVDSLGRAAGFRKESYTPIEDRIAENVAANDSSTLHMNVQKLWDIWYSNVPGLNASGPVKVWLRQSPVSPEEKHRLLKNEYILTFNPSEP